MEEGEFCVIEDQEVENIYAGIVSSFNGESFRLTDALIEPSPALKAMQIGNEKLYETVKRYWENSEHRELSDGFYLERIVVHSA